VRRKIFFAISLAVLKCFLSPPDAHLPQFAQKAGTLAACEYVHAGGIVDSYTTAVTASNKLDYFGTLRGRYGYLFTPTLLVYGTGGFAYGGTGTSSLTTTPGGWAAGGGLECMFLPHWSLKVEYLYYELAKQTSNFGTLTQNFPGGTGSTAVTHFTIEPKGGVVRVGVNYLFNWGAPAPVAAKY
jgi:outer membrane immunogenic protein